MFYHFTYVFMYLKVYIGIQSVLKVHAITQMLYGIVQI